MSVPFEELPAGCVELKVQKTCGCGFLYAYETLAKQNDSKDRKLLYILEQKLDPYYKRTKTTTLSSHFEENDYVAAWIKDWKRYCRGLITHTTQDSKGGTYGVFLIDYGISENLNIQYLRKLPREFGIEKLHEQACKLALYGVLPLHIELQFGAPSTRKAGKSWNGKDIQFIKDKLKTNDVIYFKEIEKVGDFKFGLIYLKESTQEKRYITLQQLLIKENYAIKYDNFQKVMPSIVRRFLQSPENISLRDNNENNKSNSDTLSDNESVISLSDDYVSPSSSTEFRHTGSSHALASDNRPLMSSPQMSPPKRGISRGQLIKNLQSSMKKVTFDEPPPIRSSLEIPVENQFDDAAPRASKIQDLPRERTPPASNFTPTTSSSKEVQRMNKSNTPPRRIPSITETPAATSSPEIIEPTPEVISLLTPSPQALSSASNTSSITSISSNHSPSARGRGGGRGTISLMMKHADTSVRGNRRSSLKSPNTSSSLSKDIIELTSSLSITSTSTDKIPKTNAVIETIDLVSTDTETPSSSTKNGSSHLALQTDTEIIQQEAFKRMEAEQRAADTALIDRILIVRREGGCDFEPVFKMADHNLHVELRERLGQLRIQDTIRCQQYMIPAMLTRKHVTLIEAPKQGKTLCSVISLISMLKEEEFYKLLPAGPGAKAIILCPYASRCEWIYTQCSALVKRGYDSTAITNHLRINVAYGCGKVLERDKLDELTKGYDIVICTPPCLLRLLEIPELFNLKRLCHLVLDEAHVLLDSYFEESVEIMKRAYAVGKRTDTGLILPQRVIISNSWIPKISQMVMDDVVKRRGAALLSSYLEAAVFCNLKTSLKFFNDAKKKMDDILEYLNTDAAKKNVIISFTENEIHALDEMYKKIKLFSSRRVFRITNSHFMMGEMISSWIEEARDGGQPILLVTDNTIHDIAIFDANCLIHYNAPKKKGVFSSRFMFLLRCLNIPREYLDEEVPAINNRPETVIYLGLDDYEQFPTIINIMERLHATIPKEIKSIASKLKAMREQKKSDAAFCENLKKFARCIDETSCKYRHNFLAQKDQPDPDLPINGLVKIHILHVHSATHFSVRLLEHKVGSSKWTKVSSICHPHVMNAKLKQYLDNPDNRSLHQCEAVGEIAAIETSPQIYKRVKILKVKKNEDETKIQRVMVKFMEEGTVEKVRPTVLLKLPEEFIRTPACAVDIFLCDILPVDRDIEWGECITNTVRERITALQDDGNNFFVGRIQLVVGRDMWLRPLECKQWFTSINEFTTVYNLSRDLLREKMAVVNTEHLTQLITMYQWAGFDVPDETSVNDTSIVLSPPANKGCDRVSEDSIEEQDSMNEIVQSEKEIEVANIAPSSQDVRSEDVERSVDVESSVEVEESNLPNLDNEDQNDEVPVEKDGVSNSHSEASDYDGELSSASMNSEGKMALSKYEDLAAEVEDDDTFDVNFTEEQLKAMIRNIMPGILPESSDSEKEEAAPPMIIIKPNIDWRQDLAHVFVTIYLNTDDYVVRFNTNSLYFRARYDNRVYEFDEKLYASISETTSCHYKSGVTIAVKMEKLVKRNKWTRLLKRKEAQSWVKVNKEFWVDEDEDDDVPDEYWTEKLCLPPAYVNDGVPKHNKSLLRSNLGIPPEGYEDDAVSDDDSDAYGDREEYYGDA